MNGTHDETWRARIVTATEEFTGCMVVEGGVIRSLERGDTGVAGAEDWQGEWLLPGVFWNAHSATVIHDALCAAAGITTVLDSVVIGDMDQSGTRSQTQHVSI